MMRTILLIMVWSYRSVEDEAIWALLKWRFLSRWRNLRDKLSFEVQRSKYRSGMDDMSQGAYDDRDGSWGGV